MDALDPPAPLHDPGLSAATILAQHLPDIGVVVDTDGRCSFANPRACELLGAANPEALGREWSSLRGALRPGRQDAGRSPLLRRVDLRTPAGVRKLRLEVHAVPGESRFVLLLRDRAVLGRADRAQLLASEAKANQYALTGLVHDAKGPLNNFNLTLALLSAGVARGDVLAATAEAAARRTRYIDVLQKEAARLASCIDEIHALTVRHEPTEEPIDLAATSVACARVLRHGATMREVNLELDVPEQPVMAIGDPQLVRLALLSFTICVLELTPPGGRVMWRVLREGDTHAALVVITTSRPVIPRALATALFRLSCTAESDYSGAIAARLIVEAQGGDVALRETGDGAPGFLLQLRGHA